MSLSLVAVVAVGSLGAPAIAQQAGPTCSSAGTDDMCESWVATYDGDDVAEVSSDSPADIVVSPDGNHVYSAMRTTVGSGWDGRSRWVVMAHDDTGAQEWMTRWGDPAVHSFPTSIEASPDGRLVFVSGSWKVDQVAADGHLTTIAFDSQTGDIVWKANYDGPGNGADNARELVASPDGKTLYIAGISAGRDNADLDYAAIAYDARTGAEKWVTRWDGIGAGNVDSPFAIDLNSRGDMLYLTGWSYGEGEFNNDYGTIALDVAGDDAGRLAWTARYDGVGVHAPDQASALTLSPDDRTLFVTGMSDDVDGGPPFDVNYGYATIAYDAITGEQLWGSRKQWPGSTFDAPNAIAIDPAGKRLVVTGQSGRRQLDFGTVAYDPQTGEETWSDLYGFPQYDLELGRNIVVDPRGDTFYITGVSAKSPPGVPGLVVYAPNGDQLTIAYDVMTGEKQWLARFNPSVTDFVSVQSMAISPDATKVYTAATIDDQNWDYDGDDNDAGIVAYDIGEGIPIPPAPAVLEWTDGSAVRGQYSDQTTIGARLTSSAGDPIAGAQVLLEFQGETRAVVTDDSGVASFTETLARAPGEHPFLASFEGDENNGSTSLEGVFMIEKEDSALTVTADRSARTMRAVLEDPDSAVGIAGREVVFFYRDEIVGRATTNDSGVAEIAGIAEAGRASRHIRAAFEGDGFYRASSTR